MLLEKVKIRIINGTNCSFFDEPPQKKEVDSFSVVWNNFLHKAWIELRGTVLPVLNWWHLTPRIELNY